MPERYGDRVCLLSQDVDKDGVSRIWRRDLIIDELQDVLNEMQDRLDKMEKTSHYHGGMDCVEEA